MAIVILNASVILNAVKDLDSRSSREFRLNGQLRCFA